MTEQWKTICAKNFDALMTALAYADSKGRMPDAISAAWKAFDWQDPSLMDESPDAETAPIQGADEPTTEAEVNRLMLARGYSLTSDEHGEFWYKTVVQAEADTPPRITGEDAETLKPLIRDTFIANGFTVKPGETDLKDYVYKAAYALLWSAGALGHATAATPPAEIVCKHQRAPCGYPCVGKAEGKCAATPAPVYPHVEPVADPRIYRAVIAHGGKWPPALTSGVMFYDGLRLTFAEFVKARGKVSGT